MSEREREKEEGKKKEGRKMEKRGGEGKGTIGKSGAAMGRLTTTAVTTTTSGPSNALTLLDHLGVCLSASFSLSVRVCLSLQPPLS